MMLGNVFEYRPISSETGSIETKSVKWMAGEERLTLKNFRPCTFPKVSKTYIGKPWKSTFSISPLSFDDSSPGNPRKYPHKPYIARNYCATPSPLIRGLSLFRFSCWALKTHAFWNRMRNGPLGSFKVVDFGTNRKRVYATSYWSSIVSLVVSCPVSEILQVFCWKQYPIPILPEFWEYSPWTRLLMLGLRGAKTLESQAFHLGKPFTLANIPAQNRI